MSLGLPNDGSNSYRQTIFSLVYGYEAVIFLEIQIPSLHVTLAAKITEGDMIDYVSKR